MIIFTQKAPSATLLKAMKKYASFLKICALFSAAIALNACIPPSHEKCVGYIVNTRAAQDKRSSKLLSRHDTNAVFAGTREHVCMGRSMLCPDRCGHSGTLAVFNIERYNNYDAPDKYGDPQTNEFVCMLKPEGSAEVPKEILEQIRTLKPGDKVRLIWDHIYVSDDSGAFPERPIRFLQTR